MMSGYTKNIQLTLLILVSVSACTSYTGRKESKQLIDSVVPVTHWQSDKTEHQQSFNDNGWLKSLNDPRLNHYVSIALQQNNNLRANAATVEAAIRAVRVNNTGLYPSLDFALDGTRTETENNDSSSHSTSYNTIYNGNFNIRWELDIWRKLSNQKKSAALDSKASIANHKAAQLSLVANIAKTWFTINSNQLQLELAKQQLTSQLNTLAVAEEQYKNGILSARDIYLNRTDVENQKSTILDVEQTLENSIRGFKYLLGQYPNIDLDFKANLPELNDDIPSGLPSELVTRRPDIIASQAEWQSSKFNAKAVHKNRFPSFSLTARYGASSDELNQLDKENLLWNLIGNISIPLFRAGALKAQAKQADFQADAALYNYIDVLLTSFSEVENTLSNEQRLKARLEATKKSAFFAQSGYELALEQYRSGIIDYSTMLDSQRRWFNAQTNVILLRNSVLQNRIDLNLALGGNFEPALQTKK